jgi:hypothetical protein
MTSVHNDHKINNRTRKAAVALAAGVLVVTAAATAAASSDGSPIEPTAGSLGAGRSNPIVVADAYHGVGFVVCTGGRELVTVADAYHGIGITHCIDRI